MNTTRRDFIKHTTMAGAAFGFGLSSPLNAFSSPQGELRIGMIGLDTSHAPAFVKLFNTPNTAPELAGMKVVAAYPKGSADIKSSVERIPKYTEEVKAMGVEIVDSISSLLSKVDVVLLETNDGRPHLEQAREVFKAKKPVFIDKPVAASLKDTVSIYQEAEKSQTPLFSSSSLRYMPGVQAVRYENKIGAVLGADTYSPATLEPTHPDLFWYGIHGVEILFTLMGPGCESVTRFQTPDTEVVVGKWKDGRLGTFRGTRKGKHGYGGTVFGEKSTYSLEPFSGYDNLGYVIAKFFRSKVSPIEVRETLEIYAFMEAADESKRKGGVAVSVDDVLKKAGYKSK